jgi:DNA-binding CsgD family transcriptional regulator
MSDFGEKWSIPSANTQKEYTNLPEGEYLFEVKAFINGHEEDAAIAAIKFQILSPWYRSWWAYVVYFLAVMVTLFSIYRRTIQKQKRLFQQKRQELEVQRHKFEQERTLKDKEILALQNANLQVNMEYKTQELTGYILNLTRKNEMLEDVKKEVLGISHTLDEGKPQSDLKKKIVRLISLINNNIEHDNDFEAFQSNFNLVHKDFFKTLDEKHYGLTRNEKLLCAYLKMNFSSKEIATLQNITVRGVEINRYRLRKKLNLDRDVNLTEFVQKL